MNDIKDRRSFDRIAFSNFQVSIFKNDWFNNIGYRLFKNHTLFSSIKSSVQNLSSCGSLILSNGLFKKGDAIFLMISAPGTKSIIIKGKVCWIVTGPSQMKNIGIQFLAFSHWKRYNSFKIQEQLNLLLFVRAQTV